MRSLRAWRACWPMACHPEPDDVRLILQILRQFVTMQHKLEGSAYLKERYLKLMGLVSSSEKQGGADESGGTPQGQQAAQEEVPCADQGIGAYALSSRH